MRDIPGYEGLYAATIDGRIWSYPNRLHDGIFLKPAIRKGYYFVCVCVGSRIDKRNVHRLVAMAWIDNFNNLPQVNHKDGNKLNNNVGNLEWCTASHNSKHSWEIGCSAVTNAKRKASRRNAKLMGIGRRKFDAVTVRAIRLAESWGVTRKKLAQICQCSRASIADICMFRTYKEI